MKTSKVNEKIIAVAFGKLFIIVILWLVLMDGMPSEFQKRILIIILSLSAAGVATGFSGFLMFNIDGKIKCGGSMAIFAIVYFINPVKFVAENKSIWREQSNVYFNITNIDLPVEPVIYITTSGYADVKSNAIYFTTRDIDFKMTNASGVSNLMFTHVGLGISCFNNRDVKVYPPEYKKTSLSISNDGRTYYVKANRYYMKRPQGDIKLSECVIYTAVFLKDLLTGKTYQSTASSVQGDFD